jgi:hypothetical protein
MAEVRESTSKDGVESKRRVNRKLGGKEFSADENARIFIDQKNGRIIINDGTDDRVVIGNLTF